MSSESFASRSVITCMLSASMSRSPSICCSARPPMASSRSRSVRSSRSNSRLVCPFSTPTPTVAPRAAYAPAREVGSLHSPPARENPSAPPARSSELPGDVVFRLASFGPREHLLRLAVLDQLAGIEEGGVVTDADRLLHIVRDDHDCVLLFELV